MLIDVEYLRAYFEVSQQVNKRAETAIEEAQLLDLKAVLGGEFYWDLVNNTTEQRYIDLLEGKEYQNRNNNTVSFDGIKKALAYYSFARLIDSPNNIAVTRYGVDRKTSDYSEPINNKDISRKDAQLKEVAIQLINEVLTYVELNETDYPLYEKKCYNQQVNTSYSKIQGIKNPKYKYKR